MRLSEIFTSREHEEEVKKLRFYNNENYRKIYIYRNKTEYLDELFDALFE